MTQQQQLPPRFASTGIGDGDQHMSKRKSASRFIYAAHQSTTTDDKAVFFTKETSGNGNSSQFFSKRQRQLQHTTTTVGFSKI
jgi:hypothetical protein